MVSKDMINFAFNNRCKDRTAVAVWFAVKALYKIFHFRTKNKGQYTDWSLDKP